MRSVASAVALSVIVHVGAAGAQTTTGPTSSQSPYVTPTAEGWEVTSLITVGDSAKNTPYAMVGVPDGLGALAGKFEEGRYVADKAYLTVFMNHELRPGEGIVRDHGSSGALVSQWTVHLNTLQVKAGQDLIQQVYTWDAPSSTFVLAAGNTFNRLCSADLPAWTAFYNPATRRGFNGRLFMDGEETSEGRAFGHVVTGEDKGQSYELAFLGKLAWENSVAHPNAGDRTIVVGLDDSTPGQVYVYYGTKRSSGNPVERAGLVGGKLYGIRALVGGVPVDIEGGAIDGRFQLIDVSDVAVGTGAGLESASIARGVTRFARPEDGAWDARQRNVFYFVTTGANVGGAFQSSRLYRLTFDNVLDPTAGGTIDLIVDARALDRGTDIPPATAALFDNITVDGRGHVLVQEDPGNTPYIAKTWDVDPQTRTAVQIFESDRARFEGASALTVDEESSGIIEITDLVKSARWYENGRRYYLADMQAHYELPGELVEGGQLYLISGPAQP